MTTTRTAVAQTSTLPHEDVVADRYVLRERVSGTADRELWWADDARLRRAVLLRRHPVAEFPTHLVHRLLGTGWTGVAVVLDAGTDAGTGTTSAAWPAYTVFPASHAPTLTEVSAAEWTDAGVGAAAGVVAWLIALSVRVQSVCGATVAVNSDDVLVDPRVLDGDLPDDCCPVQWMPAFATAAADDGSDGHDLLAVAAAVSVPAARHDRRARRRVEAALAVLAGPYGRARAATSLARLAGLDPCHLGLPPAGPRHAETGRRSFDCRLLAGIVPVTTRKDMTCESAEACS